MILAREHKELLKLLFFLLDTQNSNPPAQQQNPTFQQPPHWDPTGYHNHIKKGMKNTFKGAVYNFLERPTGWKCFVYHFTV